MWQDVIFKLEILSVRDATKEEIEIGGPTGEKPDMKNHFYYPYDEYKCEYIE